MMLAFTDWFIIACFFVISLAIGLAVDRRVSSSMSEFFLSGRHMPWWLLGVSIVATTSAADTPALVADIVRTNGVAGNWVWWTFLLTGMLTIFVYAKLWRRAELTTDLEFYELRYSGRPAGHGWDPLLARAKADGDHIKPAQEGALALEILCMFVGTFALHFMLFAAGYWNYGQALAATILTVLPSVYLFRLWGRLRTSNEATGS